MKTYSNPLRFAVSYVPHVIEFSKDEFENALNEPITEDNWEYFGKVCTNIFGSQKSHVDISEEIYFLKEHLSQEVFLREETLRFVQEVYKDTVGAGLTEIV